MTQTVHMLDLLSVTEYRGTDNVLELKFRGNVQMLIGKPAAEGLVLWMLANKRFGGYYPLKFEDVTFACGRPHKHHHVTHQTRLDSARYKFRQWFLCEADLFVQSGEFDDKTTDMVTWPCGGARVKRQQDKSWRLDLQTWLPISRVSLSVVQA